MRVVIGDIEAPALAEAVTRLGDVVGVRCDVSRREDIETLAEAALDAYGKVNVVCNNARPHYAAKVAERADGVLTDSAPPVPVYR